MHPMGSRFILMCSAASVVCGMPAAAQSAAEPVAAPTSSGSPTPASTLDGATAPDTRATFTPADFERFAPRNALDMAQQVPGFTIREGGNDRGLGQADTNVLINGRRISGKSNGPVDALQRIPVEDVVRLELVDGASLDIGGLSGQVLNVVTQSTGRITGQFRYSAEWRSSGVPFRWGDGQVSLAGGGEKTEWTLALENDAGRRGDAGIERVFDGAGDLIDTRQEKSNFNGDRMTLSGSFARTADNGNVLNLTGQVGGNLFDQREVSERTGTISASDRLREFTSSEDEFNYELSADYSFALGGGQLKLIGFTRYEDSPTRSEVLTTFADGSAPDGSVFVRDADEGENIIRSEFSFAGLGGDFQFALEGVRNFLDINSAFEERDDSGILQPVDFEGATARVEEDRAETSLTYSRALSPKVQLQVSVGGEYSKISQSGALGQTRSFQRPKGFVALDWNANSSLDLSGRIERQVGQLSFFDFIATTNLDQDRTNVTNSNLVPPQSWLFEVEASQSFGDLGSLNLRGFYEDISDIVDLIPIEGGGQAPGNIDSASIYGLSGELTLLFDPIGIKGLRLDTEIEYSESEVLDPLLGTPREISNQRYLEFEAELRQDFTGSPWAIGAAFFADDNRANVRLDEIADRTESPGFLRVFIENKDVFGLTLRGRIANLLDRRNNLDRTIFTDRAAGIVEFREERRRRFGTIFSVDIEGSF